MQTHTTPYGMIARLNALAIQPNTAKPSKINVIDLKPNYIQGGGSDNSNDNNVL